VTRSAQAVGFNTSQAAPAIATIAPTGAGDSARWLAFRGFVWYAVRGKAAQWTMRGGAMDNARSFKAWTTDDGALLRMAAARVKVMLLAFALAAGAASTADATLQTVKTDPSWLATNAAPAATWNTDPAFNTAGWINAFAHTPACFQGADCIWYDGQFSATRYAWFRKTFTLSDPVSSAFIIGGIDDDADIYVNGTLVFSDHNGTSQAFGPINLAPYLVQGVNLIAVAAEDNIPGFGANHTFVANLQIQINVPVPTLSPWMLALLALALASIAVLFMRRKT
jgi:hypothetical protein